MHIKKTISENGCKVQNSTSSIAINGTHSTFSEPGGHGSSQVIVSSELFEAGTSLVAIKLDSPPGFPIVF